MSTVTFAGNLAGDPELLYTHDQKPFVSCRVLVNRRIQNDAGEWVNDEPTPLNVRVYGFAATHVHDSCGSGDPIIVHGLERTESWRDKEAGEKRTKNVVVVDDRFGSLRQFDGRRDLLGVRNRAQLYFGRMSTLLVVGDGPVSRALAPMAELVGWSSVLVTSMPEVVAALPEADAVVVTSHDDDVDAAALRAALEHGTAYIGAMGSRRTQARRTEWLTGQGVSPDQLARIHGPAGLDIGADSPAEIALAILAELVATLRGRTEVGSIKDREGPIHPELGPGEAFCPTG